VPPEGLPTLKIKVEHHTDEWVDECTLAFHNEGEVAPPPGRGWRQVLRSRNSTLWYRRRWL
jgi:hypothetical protein